MKKVGTLFLLSVIINLLFSCGHLNSDYSVPAIESNYPTAEINCDGKTFNGLAICSEQNIQIQGYYNGSVRIDSDRCNTHETVDFVNNGQVNINIADPNTSCIIEVVVSVNYPQNTTTVKRSLKGIIYYKKPSTNTIFETRKIPTQTVANYKFKSENFSGNKVKVYWRGCGISVDEEISPVNNEITLSLTDSEDFPMAKKSTMNQCLLEIAIVDGTYKTRLVWLSAFYNSNFSPLSIPVVAFNKKMEVTADPSAAVISFNDDYVMNSYAKFNKNNGTLRVLTTSGRTVIGIIQNGVIEWMQ